MVNKEIDQKRLNNIESILFSLTTENKLYINDEARYFSRFLGNCFIFDEEDIKALDKEGGYYFDRPVAPLFKMIGERIIETKSNLSVFYTDKFMIINIPQYESDYLLDNMCYSMFTVDTDYNKDDKYGVPKELFGFHCHYSGKMIYFHREEDLNGYVGVFKNFYVGVDDVKTYNLTRFELDGKHNPRLMNLDGYSLGVPMNH